jgi:hypothetical protein
MSCIDMSSNLEAFKRSMNALISAIFVRAYFFSRKEYSTVIKPSSRNKHFEVNTKNIAHYSFFVKDILKQTREYDPAGAIVPEYEVNEEMGGYALTFNTKRVMSSN